MTSVAFNLHLSQWPTSRCHQPITAHDFWMVLNCTRLWNYAARQTCRRSTSYVTSPTTNCSTKLGDCLTMSSTHPYLHNPLRHRDTTSDIAHTLYSCPHTPHACQPPTSSYKCCIKTNIRRMTLQLMQRVVNCWLVFWQAANKRRLIDWLIEISVSSVKMRTLLVFIQSGRGRSVT